MEKLQKATFWTLILSESMHIFCCVLPTMVSLLSLLVGAGLLSVIPGTILDLHDLLHHWEVPVIIFSGLLLALGWGLHMISQKLDCVEASACCHPPCAPKKSRSMKIMLAATILFLCNVVVYFMFHAGHALF